MTLPPHDLPPRKSNAGLIAALAAVMALGLPAGALIAREIDHVSAVSGVASAARAAGSSWRGASTVWLRPSSRQRSSFDSGSGGADHAGSRTLGRAGAGRVPTRNRPCRSSSHSPAWRPPGDDRVVRGHERLGRAAHRDKVEPSGTGADWAAGTRRSSAWAPPPAMPNTRRRPRRPSRRVRPRRPRPRTRARGCRAASRAAPGSSPRAAARSARFRPAPWTRTTT